MRGLLAWLDERTGLAGAWRSIADREQAGGARLRHSFLAVIIALFVQEAILGVVMATYYAPTATDAWASTAYLNDQVTGGWFVRGLHHHTSYALVIVSALYLLVTAITGGYRKPREIQWLAIVGLLALSIGTGLSGSLLPWDEQAAGRLAVETGILSSTPGGGPLRRLIVGGSEFGNLTVLRLYVAHILLLPAAFGALLLVAWRQLSLHGVVTAGLSPSALKRRTPFFPNQVFIDAIAVFLVSVVLVICTQRTHGAELFAPASVDSVFSARPEWYFMPLSQLLKYFKGPLQLLGTVVLPALAVSYVALLPWIDRADGGSPARRLAALSGLGLVVSGSLTLGWLGFAADRADPEYAKSMEAAYKLADRARELARQGVLPGGGDLVFWNDPEHKVRQLYKEHCLGCHTVDGIGGDDAPEFTDYASRAWLSGLIRNASDKKYYGNTKHKDMDPYPEADLDADGLKAVVEYVVSLAAIPEDKVDPALVTRGKALFGGKLSCSDCHEVEKGKTGDGPNLFAFGSKDYVSRAIHDTSVETLFGKAAQMPEFEKKLSAEEIEHLAEFVVRLGRPGVPTTDPAANGGG